MNTLRLLLRGNRRKINLKISNLPHKQIRRDPARFSRKLRSTIVLTGINEGERRQTRSSFENGAVVGVSVELGDVVHVDGFADQIGTGGEVDYGGGGSAGVAEPGAAAVLVGDGAVDGVGVVGYAVALGISVCAQSREGWWCSPLAP